MLEYTEVDQDLDEAEDIIFYPISDLILCHPRRLIGLPGGNKGDKGEKDEDKEKKSSSTLGANAKDFPNEVNKHQSVDYVDGVDEANLSRNLPPISLPPLEP
ncbi:hypothetical protein AVEN_76258-1 [Araneus ventricosus]|uniref:Uncharacterized protein n=1 Tax=Araneus ventricosus TaxID=182803 RepID=A0A4Y2GPB1_ARAVE|nr:hypothetical protein AVEN_76258-1 [Araneus ventricosus]